MTTSEMLTENTRRQDMLRKVWSPITGEGSVGERRMLPIAEFQWWVPVGMLSVPLISELMGAGSIREWYQARFHALPTADDTAKVTEQVVRIRCRYDFPFWAACFVYIKAKGGGADVLFTLNSPQRKLVASLEEMRLAGMPIRLVILKARQWGGSTCVQLYFAWLQLVHEVGLNSLIVAHVKDTAIGIKDMFDKMLAAYPVELLHELGEQYEAGEPKMVSVGGSVNTKRIPQRNCVIKIGSAENPDSARGGDYNLVHCSEVAVWKATEGKTPEDIVRSACSGVLLRPGTAIIFESTANGTGNYFQREYDAAKRGVSQFRSLFVAWYEIEQYELPFASDEDREAFAVWLLDGRDSEGVNTDREEPGKYLWWLWQQGATLEAINWYRSERSKYNDHGEMASEYPSDDVEAFVHSGARVFDRYKVEALRGGCRPAKKTGDVTGRALTGEECLEDIRFSDDRQGRLQVWAMPEIGDDETVSDRYLCVVDIGGRSAKADWSVVLVIDRLYMMDGDKPTICAQWYGHCDIDLLAWKAAQIAKWYDDALLVVESNTLETHDRDREVEGDQSGYVLNQIRDVYDNLYARKQSAEDIREGRPRKYGFHTNVKTKPEIISTLVQVVRDGLYVERDERCLDELLTYERKPNGAYGAIPGKHDDLLMTRAIGLHICFHEMPMPAVQQRKVKAIKRRIINESTI